MAAPLLDLPATLTRPAPPNYPPAVRSGSAIVTVPPAPPVPKELPNSGDVAGSATSLDGLGELHLALSARILQLEITAATTYERDYRMPLVRDYLRSAISLRSLLLRVSMGTRVAEKLALPGFEAALGDSLRWAYLWAIDEVESLGSALAEPRIDVLGMQLHGHPVMLLPAAVAELEAAGEAADRVICALAAIDEVVGDLVKRRHCIDCAWLSP